MLAQCQPLVGNTVAHETTQHEPCLLSIAFSRDSIASSLSRSGLAATVSSAAAAAWAAAACAADAASVAFCAWALGIDSLDEVLVGGHKELQVPFSLVFEIN